MSLLQHHLMTRFRVAPTLIRTQTQAFNKSTPWNIVLGATPVPGSLMVVCIGSAQNRDYSLPAGWSLRLGTGPGNFYCWFKFAGVGESTAINIGWTSGGLGQGNMVYYELLGVRPQLPFLGQGNSLTRAAALTTSWGSHNVDEGIFEIQFQFNGLNGSTTSIDSGYTITATAARAIFAYKIYQAPVIGVNPIWTQTLSAANDLAWVQFYGAKI